MDRDFILDSQITLAPPKAPTTLIFEPNDMFATNIYFVPTRQALYSLSSTASSRSSELEDLQTRKIVAKLTRKLLLPDTVSFDGGSGLREVKLAKWMREVKIPGGLGYTIEIEPGVQFLLRTHETYRLALFSSPSSDKPIAHWKLPVPTSTDKSTPLVLVLHPDAELYRLQIILAFLIQERKIRVDTSRWRVSTTRVMMSSGVLGSGTMNAT
ncbi:hypothetical protein C8F01DRAFT_1081235 [Mycena amicta]|nr:hypothetical protein C8F01DRAFT_1081235 [Mycena amicta]